MGVPELEVGIGMQTEAVVAAATAMPWYVALGVGLFLMPVLVMMLLKIFSRGKADISVTDLASVQGGIYKATMTDQREVNEQLRADRDRAEKRNDDLMLKLTGMTDQMVEMTMELQRQTEQIRAQQAQMEVQAELLARQTVQLREQSDELARAKLTIDGMRDQIDGLEGRLNAASN